MQLNPFNPRTLVMLVTSILGTSASLLVGLATVRMDDATSRLTNHKLGVNNAVVTYPPSISELVYDSSVILVGRYITVTDGELWIVATESPGGYPPADETPLLQMIVEVDQVLKGSGHITTGHRITLTEAGHVPVQAETLSEDASSYYPFVWPADTEFLWFLSSDVDGQLYPPWYPCGRILIGSGQVACSDGERTVPGWMVGLNKQGLIEVVSQEILDPQPTPTFGAAQ